MLLSTIGTINWPTCSSLTATAARRPGAMKLNSKSEDEEIYVWVAIDIENFEVLHV